MVGFGTKSRGNFRKFPALVVTVGLAATAIFCGMFMLLEVFLDGSFWALALLGFAITAVYVRSKPLQKGKIVKVE